MFSSAFVCFAPYRSRFSISVGPSLGEETIRLGTIALQQANEHHKVRY